MNRQQVPIGWDRTKMASLALFGAAAIGYSVGAGLARPFTAAADALTALPLAIAAVASVILIRRRSSRRNREEDPIQALRRLVLWIVTVAAITGWELYCFSGSPRSAHPTLSSLFDLLDSTHLGRTVVFALWLVLGAYLVVS